MTRAAKITAVATILAFFLIAHSLRDALGIGFSAESVRQFVVSLGWWGPLTYVVIFPFRSVLLLPSMVLLTAGGICFGVLGGTVFGGLGLIFSASLKFMIGQLAEREKLWMQLPERLRARLALVDRPTSLGALALITAYPLGPAEMLHIAAILAGVSAIPFFLSVGAGSLIRAGSFSLVGSSMAHGRDLLLISIVLTGLALAPLASSRVRALLFPRRAALD